jgi:hypothetical protein
LFGQSIPLGQWSPAGCDRLTARSHCPPPNTFNFTNAPASSANTSPVTSIRTLGSACNTAPQACRNAPGRAIWPAPASLPQRGDFAPQRLAGRHATHSPPARRACRRCRLVSRSPCQRGEEKGSTSATTGKSICDCVAFGRERMAGQAIGQAVAYVGRKYPRGMPGFALSAMQNAPGVP